MKKKLEVEQPTPLTNPQLELKRKRHAEPVRGRFKDYEVPGGLLEFSFGPEFRGEKTTKYSMKDGEIYTVPRGVAIHLNKNCHYPEYEYGETDDFVPGINPYMKSNVRVARKVHRFGFIPLDFEGEDVGTEASIYTVEASL